MRRLSIGLSIALLLSVAGAGVSVADVAGSLKVGEPSGLTFPDTREYIEGWNVDQPFDGSWYWGADCQGPTYVAGQTYYLERIEFMQGEVAGTAVIEVHAHDAGDCPGGTLLTSGSYEQVATLGWQGADLDPPILVEAGETYHINFRVVLGGPSSFAIGGDIIPHCWSYGCAFWEGPASSFFWMAKFFGTYEPTPVQELTWARVKSHYR